MNTTWGKVAKWYDKHLTETAGNYHITLIIPSIQRLLSKHLGNKGSVLDLACGQGMITDSIKKLGFETVGVDIAGELIKIARAKYPNIRFEIADASAKNSLAFFGKDKFDVATIVLAIQNIKDMQGVFKNTSSVLKHGGKLIIIINHPAFRIPKQTSWGFDEKEFQYRRVDGYMSEMEIPIDMAPGTTAEKGKSELTVSYHRPLQSYFKALSLAGFSVIGLEEWISNKSSQPGPRAEAENRARGEIPMFMAIIAQLSLNKF